MDFEGAYESVASAKAGTAGWMNFASSEEPQEKARRLFVF